MTKNLPAKKFLGRLIWMRSEDYSFVFTDAPLVWVPLLRLMLICEHLEIERQVNDIILDMLKKIENKGYDRQRK